MTMRQRAVPVLLIGTMLLAGGSGRLTGAAEPRQGGEADQDASAEGATGQGPDGQLKPFSREALLALPYCDNIARGELSSTDFKLEVQDHLSSALARVSFPLPELLPNWVQCQYIYLMYNDESDWSVIVRFRGSPSQAAEYFFEPNAVPADGQRSGEPAADEPVTGRPGWFAGGGGSLRPLPNVPTTPMVVAWWRGNDYLRLIVTGYDLDGVLAIADSVR
jgi:hypothetical protein